jgi:uncharacterized protein YprB with RNaseH-like and TPR domain
MDDPVRRQLEQLRAKIARINQKFEREPASPAAEMEGAEVETALGRHWEVDQLWPAHARHGTADVGALAELSSDLLSALGGEPLDVPPERWAFLDTETTGLSGGTGTLAFLIGCGAITAQGFVLKQFFAREHGEEASMLDALTRWLEPFDVLVTYNGKAFDQPLLDTRYRLARMRPPFERMVHVDLLFSARRLWRLALESCRLQELEQRILGVERTGDVPGMMIPTLYFEYLRTRDPRPLQPVLKHNAIDILSLACLTAIVPAAFREPERLKRGAEMVGLARWFRKEGRLEDAAVLMREALKRNLDEPLLFDTLWHLADIERKSGRHEHAVELWVELSGLENPRRGEALTRLAIHFEKTARDFACALTYAERALLLEEREDWRKRVERLRRKALAVECRLAPPLG